MAESRSDEFTAREEEEESRQPRGKSSVIVVIATLLIAGFSAFFLVLHFLSSHNVIFPH